MISFCTWIKNRRWQFEQTFQANLDRIGPHNEWVIVDCGSVDGLIDWLSPKIRDQPQVRLVSRPVEHIHMSRLKNLSHSFATGEILVNLDADNVIGPKFCEYVTEHANPGQFMHVWTGNWADGTCGRLVFNRDEFWSLGGYDEALLAVGNDDLDLRDRAHASGLFCKLCKELEVVGTSVGNSNKDTMRHVEGSFLYGHLNAQNGATSQANIAAGRFIANQ